MAVSTNPMTQPSSEAPGAGPPALTIDQHFANWEGSAFGYGYGTGEEHTLGALKAFFGLLRDWDGGSRLRCYDYRELEQALTPTVAWLMINALCKDGIIEYGTSPRHGWLTPAGERLRDYVADKSVADLREVLHRARVDDIACYKDACNCGPNGYERSRVCPNPFWRDVPRPDQITSGPDHE